ncbi:MAG TPA: HAMP domain-containing methyl-accepting chemotaxis protein [Burkholderiaceae bacterium]|nr:HAMP domain-containing methyl-accepting chemotaxis protein [Burkholderiaceae bacterium]
MKLEPGFLRKLKLPHKFSFIGVLAVAMAAAPLYAIYQRNQSDIDAIRTEQAGLQPVTATLELIAAIQDFRGASSYFLLGDDKQEAAVVKLDATVSAAIAKVEPMVLAAKEERITERWQSFKRDWAALRDRIAGRKIDQRGASDAQVTAVRDLLQIKDEFITRYRLDLDDDFENSHQIRASLVELPALSESLGQLRSPIVSRLRDLARVRGNAPSSAQAMEAQLRAAFSTTDRAHFAETVKDVQEALDRYVSQAQLVTRASPDMRESGDALIAEIIQNTNSALNLVRREILGREVPTVDPAQYLADVSKPREAVRAAATKAELVTKRLEHNAADLVRAQRFFVLGAATVALLGLLVAVLIIRSITQPVDSLLHAVRRLEAGDEEARARLNRTDEIGQLGAAFDQMMDVRVGNLKRENDALNNSVLALLQAVAQLSRRDLTVKVPVTADVTGPVADALNLLTGETAKVLQQVSDISAEVTAASLKVKSQSDTVMSAAALESQQVEQTAQSLERASETMTQIAAMAQHCNSSAERAIKTTQQALETVTGTVGGINSTRDTIRETEKRIKRLGERSQEISVAVNLINSIAERTHILALNAAMHAASAGEAGRGFAVVADEVQRLAESARQSTQQIATLVNNIQVETADTVNTMNSAISQVVEGSKLAEQAGRQMQVTQEATAELVSSVQRIAEQSQQQARTTTELLERASLIKKSTQETSKQLTEQGQQTNLLVEYARNLLATVRVFKLSST